MLKDGIRAWRGVRRGCCGVKIFSLPIQAIMPRRTAEMAKLTLRVSC